MTDSGLLRWERVARWNTIMFVPISGVGLVLVAWSVHGPTAFAYIGSVLVWPWMLLLGPPFGGGASRLLASLCAQWGWCLVLMWVFRRINAHLAAIALRW